MQYRIWQEMPPVPPLLHLDLNGEPVLVEQIGAKGPMEIIGDFYAHVDAAHPSGAPHEWVPQTTEAIDLVCTIEV